MNFKGLKVYFLLLIFVAGLCMADYIPKAQAATAEVNRIEQIQWPADKEGMINEYEGIIRMHVIANSDSDEDQELKFKVRNRVLAKVQNALEGSIGAAQTRTYIENNLEEIRNLFGYDSDGDLIIDSGIAYRLDKEVTAYTQTGGILAMKTSSLDSKIKTSESKITKLESQMDEKEAQLRSKFGTMQGSLNSLESQQNAINNFTKQQNNSRN